MTQVCFVDFETTGIDLINDYPIEVGAVLVDSNLNIVNGFHSLIKPNNSFSIKESAYKVHGIDEQTIMQAPSEQKVLNELFLRLGTNYRLAAWNMSFDVAFFKALCLRNSFESNLNKINYRHLDVQTICFIAKELRAIPNNINSLSDLCSHIGLARSIRHSAFEDARLLVSVYKYLFKQLRSLTNF